MCSLGFKKSLSKVTVPVKCPSWTQNIFLSFSVHIIISFCLPEFEFWICLPINFTSAKTTIFIREEQKPERILNERNDVRPAMLMTHRKILFFFCDREQCAVTLIHLRRKNRNALIILVFSQTENMILVVRYVPRPRANSFLVFSGHFNKWLSEAVALFTTLSSNSIKVNCTIVL